MRGAPMRRGAPLRRRSGLSPVSERRRQANAEASAWYDAVWRRTWGRCTVDAMRVPPAGAGPCQGPIHAHHVWPRSTYPARVWDHDNGALLCRHHHDWTHSNPAAAVESGLLAERVA